MPAEVLTRAVLTVGAVLGGAGASIITIEKLRRRPLRTSILGKRWLTWLGLATVWILALSFPVALILVLGAITLATSVEYSRLARLPALDRTVLVLVALLSLAVVVTGGDLHLAAMAALPAFTLPPVVGQDIDRGLSRIGHLLTGFVVTTLPVLSLWVISRHSAGVLLALLFGVALSDVGAFTLGSTLGRHRLAPALSPNKTWEGSAGNLVGAAAGVLLASAVAGLRPTLSLVLIGVTALGSVWGDLLESLLKRGAGVKDAGAWLPGFGGALDRVDSLIVAAPLTLLVIEMFGVG